MTEVDSGWSGETLKSIEALFLNMTDALKLAEAATDRLFEAHDLPLDRSNVHVGVARWTGRNGICKYNKRLDDRRFGKKMPSLPRRAGNHAIVINERILEDGNRDGFIDTIQHELAHAVCYEREFEYPAKGNGPYSHHGSVWKQAARELGADPSSRHHKRDRSDEKQYYIVCPECGTEGGRTKRSKVIKRPFERMCSDCGHHPLSSYEQGQEPPKGSGIVKVESLDWSNRKEWQEAGRP